MKNNNLSYESDMGGYEMKVLKFIECQKEFFFVRWKMNDNKKMRKKLFRRRKYIYKSHERDKKVFFRIETDFLCTLLWFCFC